MAKKTAKREKEYLVLNTITEGRKNAPSTAICGKGRVVGFDKALKFAVDCVMEQQSAEDRVEVETELRDDLDYAHVDGDFTVTIIEIGWRQ